MKYINIIFRKYPFYIFLIPIIFISISVLYSTFFSPDYTIQNNISIDENSAAGEIIELYTETILSYQSSLSIYRFVLASFITVFIAITFRSEILNYNGDKKIKIIEKDMKDSSQYLSEIKKIESQFKTQTSNIIDKFENQLKELNNKHEQLNILHTQANNEFRKETIDGWQNSIFYNSEILQIKNEDSYACYQMGHAYRKLQNYTTAIHYFKKALEIDPNNLTSNNNIGLSLNDQGQYLDALPYFDKAINQNYKDPYAYNNRGFSYLNLKNYTAALKDFNNAISLNINDFYAHKNLATLYKEIGLKEYDSDSIKKANIQFDNAIKEYSIALKINAKAIFIFNEIGVILQHQNKFEISKGYFEDALRRDGQNPTFRINYAKTLIHLKEYQEAHKILILTTIYDKQAPLYPLLQLYSIVYHEPKEIPLDDKEMLEIKCKETINELVEYNLLHTIGLDELSSNPNLNNIRGKKWFKDAINNTFFAS